LFLQFLQTLKAAFVKSKDYALGFRHCGCTSSYHIRQRIPLSYRIYYGIYCNVNSDIKYAALDASRSEPMESYESSQGHSPQHIDSKEGML